MRMNGPQVIQNDEKVVALDGSLREVNMCLIMSIEMEFQMSEEG